MEEKKKINQTENTQQTIECCKCDKLLLPTLGIQKKCGFVCNECFEKAKKLKKTIFIISLLLLCVIGGGGFYMNQSETRTANGFAGEENIIDSTVVKIDSANIEFKLSTASISSSPVSIQAPISNVEDFKQIVNANLNNAKKSKINEIVIPVSAVKFSFKSSVLSNSDKYLINEIVELYNKTSKNNIFIVNGYACNIGNNISNDVISRERALAVALVLKKAGIPEEQIQIHWFGKTRNSEFKVESNSDYRRVLIEVK